MITIRKKAGISLLIVIVMLAFALLASVVLVPDMKVTAYAGSNDSVYTPLSVTGFDADVVADDGSWSDGWRAVNGRYIDTTEETIEDYGHVFVSSSFGDGAAFPAGETINTASGKSYTLQSSTANNALQVARGSGFFPKTLTLTTPGSYEKIGVLSTGGGGDASLLVVVHYSDGSQSEAIPLSSPDWYGGSEELRVYGPLSRTQNYNPYDIEGTGAYLFETTIDVDPDKAVTSIDFNFNGDNNAVANIFAISGMAAELKHTVTFDLNGHGEPAPAIQKVSPEGKATKPSDPQESGYTFSGWYKESNCETAWDFAIDTVTSNITLYAKWVEKPHVHDDITFNPWSSEDSLPHEAGNWYLTEDVTLSSTWTAPAGTTNLCLNGHGVIAVTSDDNKFSVITVNNDATFNLYDGGTARVHRFTVIDPAANGAGLATVNDALIGEEGADYLTFVGGYITGGYGFPYGGGVYVNLNGRFNMYGGTIIGNKATSHGGGVGVSSAAYKSPSGVENFVMYGGAICYNQANWGGAIGIYGNVYIHNEADVSYNVATSGGGGIELEENGRLYMDGGLVHDNVILSQNAGMWKGGGVHVPSGSEFHVSGAVQIVNNYQANEDSGKNNVYVRSGLLLTIGAELAQNASVGVTMQSGSGAFTSEWSAVMVDADPADYFSSDNGYDILLIGGEAVCGIQPVASVTNGDVTTEYQTFAEALSAWADGTTLTLLKNVTSDRINVTGGVTKTLDLNGKTITLVATNVNEQRVLCITGEGTTLNLIDSSGTNAGKLTGVDPENDDGWSGAIYINSGSIVNMYGGTISGNNSIRGAGVWIDGRGHRGNATFNMYGGLITGNTSTKPEGTLAADYSIGGGGGVFVGAYLGTAPTIGNACFFNMYGGTITGNKGTNGDNVYVDRGVMNMVGGTIDGGFAHSDYVTVTFDANGGTGTMSVQYVKKSTNTQVKDNTYYDLKAVEQDGYACEGYILSGWNTQADGKGTKYAVGTDNVNFGEDTTLYAMWKSLRVLEVEALIDEIPTPVTEEDKEKIDEARKAYDDLPDEKKGDVDNYEMLVQAEVRYVEVMIESIGTVEYTPDSKAKIDLARTEYDALADGAKEIVNNKQVLLDAEGAYAKLKYDNEQADAVDALIDAIGEVVYTAECKGKIDVARTAYDALTDEQKALVDDYQGLIDAEKAYEAMDRINAIGAVVYTAECKGKIDAARTAYDALTDEQKALVEGYADLTDAEAAYAKLKYDNEQADAVDALIDAIGEVVYTAECYEKIVVAREGYDALTDEQKVLVDDYQGLIDAEKAYEAMDRINAIGTVEYTAECKDKIDAARKAYDNVPESKKGIVSNYPDLEDAENKYARLEFENAEPEESEYKISGIVRVDDQPLGGVTMTLKNGNQAVETTVTRSDGSYRFILPKGVYSIVAEYEGIVETTAISLFADTEKDITLSGGKTESKLEVKASEEDEEGISVAVSGLDKEAQTIREAENVSADQSVSVVMTVEKIAEDVAEEQEDAPAQIIQNAAPERNLDFYEIEVVKTVGDGEPETLLETAGVIEIAIPYAKTHKRGLIVYSYHGEDVVTFVESDTREAGTFRVDKENGVIYIYTKTFSTYAIGYAPYYRVSTAVNLGSYEGTVNAALTDKETGEVVAELTDVDPAAILFPDVAKGEYLLTITWTEGAENSITMPVSVGPKTATPEEPASEPEDAPAGAAEDTPVDPIEEAAKDLEDVVLEERKYGEDIFALPKRDSDLDAA